VCGIAGIWNRCGTPVEPGPSGGWPTCFATAVWTARGSCGGARSGSPTAGSASSTSPSAAISPCPQAGLPRPAPALVPLAGDAAGDRELLLDGECVRARILDRGRLEALLAELPDPRARRPEARADLAWRWLTLEWWYRQLICGPGGGPSGPGGGDDGLAPHLHHGGGGNEHEAPITTNSSRGSPRSRSHPSTGGTTAWPRSNPEWTRP
jgi:hypothetical protein